MINVDIKKPIYGNYVAIRDKYLKIAIREKTPIRLTTPSGTYIVDPKKWIKTGEKIKKVFLIPDEPMVLVANHATRFPLEETVVAESEALGLTAALSKLDLPPDWEALGRKLHGKSN